MRIIVYIAVFLSSMSFAQNTLEITVRNSETAESLIGARVSLLEGNHFAVTDAKGLAQLNDLNLGPTKLLVTHIGYENDTIELNIKSGRNRKLLYLKAVSTFLDPLKVGLNKSKLTFAKLRAVDGMALYQSKKSDLIIVDNQVGNKSANNAREMFNQVAGLNIWESDGGGLQLGIGGRGLSPDRSSNFNMRQNGYDISADALGYPESYYTPPVEALERIEVVRGAASLQYGTQFGGYVNFKLKVPFQNKRFGIINRSTYGSNGYMSNFTHFGGKLGLNSYSAYVNLKKGDDFRPNSQFEQVNAHALYKRIINENTIVSAEFTKMAYLAQQPGGLTDDEYMQDPYMSDRDRNWFKVNWNLAAVKLKSKISKHSMLDARVFGLMADRQSLGYLGRADRPDPMTDRTLIKGSFNNLGMESRFLAWYGKDTLPHVLLTGFRVYTGRSTALQGDANDGSDASFEYNSLESLDSDYLFPSANLSFFAENIFNVTSKFSVTPGLRFEHITTKSDGYYVRTFKDLAGNVIERTRIDERETRSRNFVIAGLGTSYELTENIELYGNFSQNYRAITFNDIRIVNPNFRIDPEIKDEKGYSADLGLRGTLFNALAFDLSVFYLFYNDRIGLISQVDNTLNSVYMLRTNIGNSRNLGLESFVSLNMIKLFSDSSEWDLNLFLNTSLVDAQYVDNENSSISGNRVELAPEMTFKSGLNVSNGKFGAAWQLSYTSFQYTDASNSEFTANAVNGLIPSYAIQDVSLFYQYKLFRLETGINNLANEVYFTRRASGYPGPGILPSAGRTFYLTLQLKI